MTKGTVHLFSRISVNHSALEGNLKVFNNILSINNLQNNTSMRKGSKILKIQHVSKPQICANLSTTLLFCLLVRG
jgi:hypothetical protein